MSGLAILFGSLVGFALGMTGGGGGIFAVPLLVFGLSVAPREAVGISLAAVGGTSLFGALPRLVRGEVELRTGALFAVAGMLGAPAGVYLSTLVPADVLLGMFAVLMLVVAYQMWRKATVSEIPGGVCKPASDAPESDNTCHRGEDGKLQMTSGCALVLALAGLATGVLSGMFGVGGGLIIVPALVLFSGMGIHRAVATSLFVIVLVSISGVASHFASGNTMSFGVMLAFLVGGCGGMLLGGIVAKRLSGPVLQRTFSVAIVLVAAFVIFQSALS